MMASPVTFVIFSSILLLTLSLGDLSEASSDKIKRSGNRNGIDFRQPDLPALYSAPRSHQEQENQDNEVDQQSSTDRDGVAGTTTEIYFDERDEGTSEDYQFTGTTQTSRDYQNSEPQSSNRSQEKSSRSQSQPNKDHLGGYESPRQNDNFHNDQQDKDKPSLTMRQSQYQRRPLDQQQIENHHYPTTQISNSPLTGREGTGGHEQINSFYGIPILAMNTSSRQIETQGHNFNSQPSPVYISSGREVQPEGLMFQQGQTRYLPPILQQVYQRSQPQSQSQESVYNIPGVSIPPRITIPPRDSSTGSSQIPQTQIPVNDFPLFQQQQQQQQNVQQRQQRPENFERPQPSLGQYLPPLTQYESRSQETLNQNQITGHQFNERQPHTQHQQQGRVEQQQQQQYLPPRNEAQPHHQQQQQFQQPPTNFQSQTETRGTNGISQINTNTAFEIDEPHDDTIVDAELLLRVQRIIEEHERQQKELQDKFRRENEATENFLGNKNLHDNFNNNNVYQSQSYFGNNNNDNNNNQRSNNNQRYNEPSNSQSQAYSSPPQYKGQETPRDSANYQIGTGSFPVQNPQGISPTGNGETPLSGSPVPVENGVGARHSFQPQVQNTGGDRQGGYGREVYQDVTNSINNVQHYEPSSSRSQGRGMKEELTVQWSNPPNGLRNVPKPHSQANETDENLSPRQSNTKSHIEYQKAILSDHFVETQTESPSRGNSFRHQEYLPPSSSPPVDSTRENPEFTARRVTGSFNPQFASSSPPTQTQGYQYNGGIPSVGSSPSSGVDSSQLNSKINSNYYRPNVNVNDQPQNENHGPFTPYPNELPNRQSGTTQNLYESQIGNSQGTLQLGNQILNSFYGLPSQSQSQNPGERQNNQNYQQSFNGHSGPMSNYNDIGNQNQPMKEGQEPQNERVAIYPSSQDQLSQTYHNLASMYPTSFTSNGNSRTIVVHEVPYGSIQGVTNRALISPQVSPSLGGEMASDNQFLGVDRTQNSFSSQDNSHRSGSSSSSDNDINFPPQNNPISYQSHSPSSHESSSHHNQYPSPFLVSQPQSESPNGRIVESGGDGNFVQNPNYYAQQPFTLNSHENQIQISTPQPIYGIPLAPALGLDSITSSIDENSGIILPQNSFILQDSQPLTSEAQQQQQEQISNDTVIVNPTFYAVAQQQEEQPQEQQKYYLPPSQTYGVIVNGGSGQNNLNNDDQLYINQIISAYNALATQEASWNPSHPQDASLPPHVTLNNVDNVGSSFSRLPDARVLYGPPSQTPSESTIVVRSSSSPSIISSRNDFYPRHSRRSVRKRITTKVRRSTTASPVTSKD